MSRRTFTSALVAIALLSINVTSQAELAVSPAGLEASEGGTLSGPWPSSSRGMTIIASSTFDEIDGPIRVTGFNWRPDSSVSNGAVFGFDNLELIFSVTPREPAQLSTTFAANLSGTLTVPMTVFDGPWSAEATSDSGQRPRPFDFKVPLTDPFEFDPADGNLLIDFRFGSPIQGQSAFDRDFSTYPDHKTQWGQSTSLASGQFVVPAQLEFEAVPEPSARTMTLFSLLAFVTWGRGTRKRMLRRE